MQKRSHYYEKQTIRELYSIMKRTLLSLFALIVCVTLYAEKERRVYYLDCSYSMISNGLWKDVRDNLFKAIDNIEDATTELYVIPFAVDGSDCATLDAFIETATPDGKERLKNKIKHIKPSKKSMTYHWNPMNDFYVNSRMLDNGVTYMFLMTDGEDEHSDKNKFPNLLKDWKKHCRGKNIYGFYVILHPSARNTLATAAINTQSHLWEVETADLNINLIRLESGCVFNARNNQQHVDIPVSGNIDTIDFQLDTIGESDYAISNCEKYSDFIRVHLKPKKELSHIPEDINLPISIKLEGAGDFVFLLTDTIEILCENEYFKTIAPTFNKGKKIEKLGEVVYYPKFWWSQEKSEELSTVLQLQPSDDAAANNCYVEFEFVDKDGKIIPTSELRIKVDDVLLDRNRFTANCNKDTYTIKFEYTPEAKGGKHQGYLRLVSHNIDRCGNHDLSSCNGYIDVLCWHINYVKKMNPLAEIILWCNILIFAAFVAWILFFKPLFYPRFRAIKKTLVIPNQAPIVIRFKGARLVVIDSTRHKQSWWNRFWTGKIIYKQNHSITSPITLKPTANGKKVLFVANTAHYTCNPNPIDMHPATIIDRINNQQITIV